MDVAFFNAVKQGNGKTKFPMLPPLLAVFEKRGHYHEETNFKEAYLRDNLPS